MTLVPFPAPPASAASAPGLSRASSRCAMACGDILRDAPDRIRQKLFDAFDIQALYSKTHNQVTFWATITPSTPAALAAIIAASETPDLAVLLTTQDHPSDLASQPGWAQAP